MFCKNCGKEIEDGVNFCPSCGTQITIESHSDENVVDTKDEINTQESTEIKKEANGKVKGLVYTGFICCICSGFFSFFTSVFSIACALVGLVISFVVKNDEIDSSLKKFNKAAIILGIIGGSLSLFFLIYGAIYNNYYTNSILDILFDF